MTEYANAGFDDWLRAIEEGDPYYLECENEHGSLPPRRVCPECGTETLSTEPLAGSGTIETVTVTHVAAPSFEANTPYAVAIVDFGPVTITGQVAGSAPAEVEIGTAVQIDIHEREQTNDRLVVFHPD